MAIGGPDINVPEGDAPEGEEGIGAGLLARFVAGLRRTQIVPISGPAPANNAAFVTFGVTVPSTWTSADIPVGIFSELQIDFDVTAIVATGTVQLLIDRRGADGQYRNIVAAVAKTGVATDIVSLGVGLPLSAALGTGTGASVWSVPVAFGDVIRIRIVVAVANLTSATLAIKGK